MRNGKNKDRKNGTTVRAKTEQDRDKTRSAKKQIISKKIDGRKTTNRYSRIIFPVIDQ